MSLRACIRVSECVHARDCLCVCMCWCSGACSCVRACVRACACERVRACVCMRACERPFLRVRACMRVRRMCVRVRVRVVAFVRLCACVRALPCIIGPLLQSSPPFLPLARPPHAPPHVPTDEWPAGAGPAPPHRTSCGAGLAGASRPMPRAPRVQGRWSNAGQTLVRCWSNSRRAGTPLARGDLMSMGAGDVKRRKEGGGAAGQGAEEGGAALHGSIRCVCTRATRLVKH